MERFAGASRSSDTVHEIRTDWPESTQPVAFSAGADTLGGALTVNHHGFGTGESSSQSPSSLVRFTDTRYLTPGTRKVPLPVRLAVRTVCDASHEWTKDAGGGRKGMKLIRTFVRQSIASLNVTTMSVAGETLFAPSTGSVAVTYGRSQLVMKLHGFGTAPRTRGRPSSESFARTSTS